MRRFSRIVVPLLVMSGTALLSSYSISVAAAESQATAESGSTANALRRLSTLKAGLAGDLSCGNSRARVFARYYDAFDDDLRQVPESLPKAEDDANVDAQRFSAVIDRVHAVIAHGVNQLIVNSAAERGAVGAEREDNVVLHLIRLEMRSRIQPEYVAINRDLDEALQSARAELQAQNRSCEEELQTDENLMGDFSRQGDLALAARKVMAIAYQSCGVLDLAPLDNSVPVVQGVKKAIAIDKTGWGRAYTDIALLKKTHYYHARAAVNQSCFKENKFPLVYDYGGVPKIESRSKTLDLFKNVGGGPALGIDCSALVASSAASAGNLYRRATSNRPVYTRFTSRDFIDPDKSNWNCYESVWVDHQSTLVPGDIGAIHGHVVMVDSVGRDPFGLSRIARPEDCQTLDARSFDFILIQSSSSQDHMGINRYLARDYLNGDGNMATLFKSYAKQACLSKFDHLPRRVLSGSFGMIRHKRTEKCLAEPVKIQQEQCVLQCPQLR